MRLALFATLMVLGVIKGNAQELHSRPIIAEDWQKGKHIQLTTSGQHKIDMTTRYVRPRGERFWQREAVYDGNVYKVLKHGDALNLLDRDGNVLIRTSRKGDVLYAGSTRIQKDVTDRGRSLAYLDAEGNRLVQGRYEDGRITVRVDQPHPNSRLLEICAFSSLLDQAHDQRLDFAWVSSFLHIYPTH
ncbi:MAG: hypothetical protein KTR24_05905 [Saprospiraceae bacterium]|nr:hypothetical protein [Saprospiraceae bacterium]